VSGIQAGARKLVLVEDQDDGREMLRVLLGRAGYDVIDVANGTEAMRAIAEHRPDVAIVDIGLPDMTGFEVGRFARGELGRSLLLIALTGYGQERDRAQVFAAGFDHHLVKPVDLDALTRLLEQRHELPVSA
jgi:CheY-like chemotaxis protein